MSYISPSLEEQQEARAGRPPLDTGALAVQLRAEYDEAERARGMVNLRWLEDLRQYRGMYAPEVLARLKKTKRAKVYYRMTTAKINTMTARLMDLLFPQRVKNWAIEPTPDPMLPDDVVMQDMQDEISAAAEQIMGQTMQGLQAQNTVPDNFGTSPIAPSYLAVCHTDCEADIREMPGFVPVEKYGSYKPLDGEIGSVEGVRYCCTTVLDPWLDAGAAPAAGKPVESNEGACADVYPVLFFGKNAFGNIPLARSKNGASPITPMVLNPGQPRGGDPLGQRGTIGWKAYHAAIILYDFYMARAEVAVSKV